MALHQYLQQHSIRFLAREPLGGVSAHICFPGKFQGEQVVWDTRIYALLAPENVHRKPLGQYSQYLEIQTRGNGPVRMEVGVAEANITSMVAAKVVIMVQNYRRLCEGRHEYGSQVTRQT